MKNENKPNCPVCNAKMEINGCLASPNGKPVVIFKCPVCGKVASRNETLK